MPARKRPKTPVDSRITDTVLRLIAEHFKTTADKITSGDGRPSEARKFACYIFRKIGLTMPQIKPILNIKSDPTIYQYIRWAEANVPKSKALGELEQSVTSEVLMIGVAGAPAPGPGAPAGKGPAPAATKPAPAPTPLAQPSAINDAVAKEFLSASLLSAPDATEQILLARSIAVFLSWELGDTSAGTERIQKEFGLNEEGFFAVIGRVTVLTKSSPAVAARIQTIRKGLGK